MDPITLGAAYACAKGLQMYNDHYYAPKHGQSGRLDGLADIVDDPIGAIEDYADSKLRGKK